MPMELWPGFLVAFVIILLVDFILFALFPLSSVLGGLYIYSLVGDYHGLRVGPMDDQ